MKKIVMLCLSAGIQKTISFECFAPGEVNRSKTYRYDASGKAVNSARVLTQLAQAEPEPREKTDVSVICPLGERNKDFFLSMASSDGLNVRSVIIPGFTRECCTLIDEANQLVTELVVEEPVPEGDSAQFEEKLMECLRAELGLDGGEKADALLFAGSRPKFWSAGIIKRIAATAKENGILFMADFRGNDLLSILGEYTPDIIKINEDEFWATFGTTKKLPATFGASSAASAANNEERLFAAIAEKSRQLNNIIVVTRGKERTLAATRGTKQSVQTERVKAVNTIGCGDAYNAGFLYEYIKTKDVQKALEKGKWCASRNAENIRPGVIC